MASFPAQEPLAVLPPSGPLIWGIAWGTVSVDRAPKSIGAIVAAISFKLARETWAANRAGTLLLHALSMCRRSEADYFKMPRV